MSHVNVVEPFLESVAAFPDKTALIYQERNYTYTELNARVNTAATLLQEFGVQSGMKVAYLLPNCNELIEVYYALQKIGAVAVPLNTRLIEPEIAYLLAASDASVLVYGADFEQKAKRAISSHEKKVVSICVGGIQNGRCIFEQAMVRQTPTEPELFKQADSLSRIQYTGGTSGCPKGAARTHRADLVEFKAILESNDLAKNPDNVVLIQCPIEHHGGHSWFTISFAAGVTVVLCGAFDAEEILAAIERYHVTYMILLPPTSYARLLCHPKADSTDFSSLRLLQSSAGGTTEEIIELIYRKIPHAVLNYGWGQSESGAGTSLKITREMLEQGAPEIESVGKPMKYAEMKIVDKKGNDVPDGEVGEALFRSEAVMSGYYNHGKLATYTLIEDGWLKTGDLMIRDGQGYYYVKSRMRDLIKSGGENVFVAEVENTILKHPAVEDCVVFGIDDIVLGEAVSAVVQLRPGEQLSLSDLQEHCKKYISSYKKPRQAAFVKHIERDDAGKVRKTALIETYQEQFEKEARKICLEDREAETS